MGISDLFSEQVQANHSTSKSDSPLTTAGGIPQTKVNDKGVLEIFEAYESDDNSPAKPTVKKVIKPKAQPS